MENMVHFFDGNNPGVIFVGTEADMIAMDNEGGNAMRWKGNPPVGGTIEVKIESKTGNIKIEKWPVEKIG